MALCKRSSTNPSHLLGLLHLAVSEGGADGVARLEEGLLARPELFVRTLSEKLLIFA